MAENEKATNPTPEVEVTSEEKQEINLILLANKQLPAAATATRGGATIPLVPKEYARGNKADYGCKYLGVPDEWLTKENAAILYSFIGEDKLFALAKQFVNQVCLGASENAIQENGSVNVDLILKGIQEFSSRGEPTGELVEREKAAKIKLFAISTEAFIRAMQMGPDGKPAHPTEYARVTETREELQYTSATILARKRGPRQPKAA